MPPRPVNDFLKILQCMFKIMSYTCQFIYEVSMLIEQLLWVSMIGSWQREFLPSWNLQISIMANHLK